MRFRAVLFDVGETLVHPEPTFSSLFASMLSREGFARDVAEVEEASKCIAQRFSRASRDRDGWTFAPERSEAFWLGVYSQMLGTLGLRAYDRLLAALFEAFTDLDNYELFEDVRSSMSTLRSAGLTLGIVSNYEPWLEDLLVRLGIADELDVRVISGLEGVEKPDLAIYLLALDRLGLEPAQVAFVGDSPEFDVDPPASLGMLPILIDRRERHLKHEGIRITDLRDLASMLEAAA